jgi:hypothetical protein
VEAHGVAEFNPGPALETLVRPWRRLRPDRRDRGDRSRLLVQHFRPGHRLRERANLERLADALRELGATLRGGPPGLSFRLDADSLEAGLNFTFETKRGDLDVFGEPVGAPAYAELKRRSSVERIEGVDIHVASIDHLIAMKDAAGRGKDRILASDLRTLSDRIRRRER